MPKTVRSDLDQLNEATRIRSPLSNIIHNKPTIQRSPLPNRLRKRIQIAGKADNGDDISDEHFVGNFVTMIDLHGFISILLLLNLCAVLSCQVVLGNPKRKISILPPLLTLQETKKHKNTLEGCGSPTHWPVLSQ